MSDNGVKKIGSNNTEGLSPGSCSARTQANFGRHPITARGRKWTKEENIVVMECYYKSIISNATWHNARTTHANCQTLTKSLRLQALSSRYELFRVMLISGILGYYV